MNLIKWIGGFVLTLVLLIAIAIVVIPRVVDPNDYREQITTLVKDNTGRDLKLDGDLSISVFPWLGVRTQGLSLSQPAEIGGDMLSVDTAQLRLKLLPLLSKRLEIDTVILEKPQVSLITLNSGISSFTGLTGEEAVEEEVAADSAGAGVALLIQGVELTQGSLLWDDRAAGQSYQVNDLNLITGNLIGDNLADLDVSGTLIDSSAPEPTDFSLSGKARIDTDTLQVTAQGLDVNIKQLAQMLSLNIAQLSVDQTQGIAMSETTLSADMSIASEPEAGQPELAPTPVSVKADLPDFTFNQNSGAISGSNINISGAYSGREFVVDVPQLSANLDKQTADIDSINVSSGDLKVNLAQLKVTQFIDNLNATGTLDIPAFDARALIKDLDIDFEPAAQSALTAVGFKTKFDGGVSKLALRDMALKLDQSDLTGSFAANDFENINVEFDLALNQLNLDSYLPAAEEGAVEEDAASGAEALAVPMALFKDITANGSFKAQQLISGGLELNDIDVQIESTPGNVTITPKANLYDGSLGGVVAYSEGSDKTTLNIKNDIDLVSLGKFLTAADVSDQLSGIGTLGLDINVTEKDGVQSNEGTIKLLAKNGAIQGVDIKNIVDSGYQKYNQLKGREEEQAEQGEGEGQASDETRFAELLGTFYLKDNRLTNDDFSMKAPLFRVTGEGEFDLANETINYLVRVAIVNSTDGQGGQALADLAGITIPIRFKGSLTAPSYAIDMKALYKSMAKRELDKKKGEFLQEKLGIEGGEKLSTKDLLRQALVGKDGEEESESETETETETDTDSAAAEPKRELTKKERRDQRKKKLLDGLFKKK